MHRQQGDRRRNGSRTIAGGTGAQNQRTRQHCPAHEDMMGGDHRFRKVILAPKQGLLVSFTITLRVGLHMHRSTKHQRE